MAYGQWYILREWYSGKLEMLWICYVCGVLRNVNKVVMLNVSNTFTLTEDLAVLDSIYTIGCWIRVIIVFHFVLGLGNTI
jgi:hypothetical protein